jgi:hypothetical protein
MNEEDEAFNEIERRAKQRMEAVKAAMRVEDDDIQDYKKPWVGLTDKAITKVVDSMPRGINGWMSDWDLYEYARAIEAKLKEKNT